MAAIDDAIAVIESRKPGEHFSYRAIATQFGVDHTTLLQRHQGCQMSQEAQRTQQQKLNPQQEEELVRYIEDLTKRVLPPTREMMQNFVLRFNPKGASESWVKCFIRQKGNDLVSKWSSGIDS
jgi:predicted HicB family RNase H-like nuclease